MSPEEIVMILQERFGDAVVQADVDSTHPHVVVRAEAWPDIARFLRDDDRLGFDWLRCISAVDYPNDQQVAVVYELHATQAPDEPGGLWRERHGFAVKVRLPRENPRVGSVVQVWPAAEWHEREAFDLMGVVFEGHPDLRRILCPDDWVGHPLRKDYEFPKEYEGIPGTAEPEPSGGASGSATGKAR